MLGRYNAQGLGLKEETLTRQMIVTSGCYCLNYIDIALLLLLFVIEEKNNL